MGGAALAAGLLAVVAGCGAASSGSKPAASGSGKCVAGAAANGATGTAPLEPASGVDTITGKCWAQIKGSPITMSVIGSQPAGTSASWKAAYTAKDLYIYTNVVTGRPLINSNKANPWEDDTVEIYLSGTNDHSGPYPQGTGQILVNSAGLTNSSFGTDHGKLPTSGAKELEHTTSKGYQILLAMPWGNLGTTVKKGADVGFSIGVDFPGTGAAKRSQGGGQLMWQGTKNNYATDSGWGAIKLA